MCFAMEIKLILAQTYLVGEYAGLKIKREGDIITSLVYMWFTQSNQY